MFQYGVTLAETLAIGAILLGVIVKAFESEKRDVRIRQVTEVRIYYVVSSICGFLDWSHMDKRRCRHAPVRTGDKEVINACDCKKLGYVVDLIIDECKGCIEALVIPKGGKTMRLLQRWGGIYYPVQMYTEDWTGYNPCGNP